MAAMRTAPAMWWEEQARQRVAREAVAATPSHVRDLLVEGLLSALSSVAAAEAGAAKPEQEHGSDGATESAEAEVANVTGVDAATAGNDTERQRHRQLAVRRIEFNRRAMVEMDRTEAAEYDPRFGGSTARRR